MNQKERDRQEAIESLRKILKPGDTIYTVLRHVSRSGMFRKIDFYKITKNTPSYLTWNIATILGLRFNSNDRGAGVSGCGMDMGFHCVYSLGRYLFPDGDGKYITGRNGDTEPETDGGYLLNQRWM